MPRKELIPLADRADNLQHRHQVITVGGVTMALFATGNILGFSSFTIPELIQDDTDTHIKATLSDLSWIASLVTIGCIVGSLLGGISSDTIGRKRTILIASLFFTLGWIVIGHARTVGHILIGRMITGVASGIYSAAVQVYICEIVEPSIRGVSGTLPSLMVGIGIVSVYCLGGLFKWRTVAHICASFPILVFLYMLLLPESPVWLISKGQNLEALRALTWLRNDDNDAEQECMRLEYLQERRTYFRTQGNGHGSLLRRAKGYLKRLTEPAVLKPLGIGLGLFFFQQFCGIYPITFYLKLIFEFADNFMNDSIETISIGFVRMFVTFIALFLVKFLSRRFLLITSGLLMCIANALLGGYFYLREMTVSNYYSSSANNVTSSLNASDDLISLNYSSTVPSSFSPLAAEITIEIHNVSVEWVPLVCLLLFMFGYCIGYGVIPYFFIAEITASDVRSLSCSIAMGFMQICLFTSVKTFLDLLAILTSYGTFWLYSAVAFAGVIFVIACVPETFDLDSSEIEAIFESEVHLFNHQPQNFSALWNVGGSGGGGDISEAEAAEEVQRLAPVGETTNGTQYGTTGATLNSPGLRKQQYQYQSEDSDLDLELN